jgi:hypothetical protein
LETALAMMSWLVRLLLAMVGSLAGCFVATCVDNRKDEPDHQMINHASPPKDEREPGGGLLARSDMIAKQRQTMQPH